MKTINIAEFKAHLSRYLKVARRGGRIVVLDRRDPVAELGPPPEPGASPWERLAREDRLTLGTQDWGDVDVRAARKRIPVQELLDEVRGNR